MGKRSVCGATRQQLANACSLWPHAALLHLAIMVEYSPRPLYGQHGRAPPMAIMAGSTPRPPRRMLHPCTWPSWRGAHPGYHGHTLCPRTWPSWQGTSPGLLMTAFMSPPSHISRSPTSVLDSTCTHVPRTQACDRAGQVASVRTQPNPVSQALTSSIKRQFVHP